MAVTKQTYTATAPLTPASIRDIFRQAFIDAGLMTEWHASFSHSNVLTNAVYGVMRIQYDPTRTYGTSFYCFSFRPDDRIGVALASGWGTNNPTGTQFLDYHTGPESIFSTASNVYASDISGFQINYSSSVFLDRFTSADDPKQSWFVVRQGQSRSWPFSFLHKDTSLHPWLDLDKGLISGHSIVIPEVWYRMAGITFMLRENLRRCLLTGTALRGDAPTGGANGRFHGMNYRSDYYVGLGSKIINPQIGENYSFNYYQPGFGGFTILPVGKASANPTFLTDYVPVCTNLPWSPFTPTRLADDFGIYMHYSDNTTVYGDRFVTQAGVNEWETLQFINNDVVVDGASATFLARVV